MNSTLIIAEAGVNHNGDIQLAKQLIDAAKTAGADAVKFQTFKAEKLVTVTAKQADYQTQNTGVSESQFEMLKRLELSDEAHLELNEYAALKSIQFLSSAFDLDGIAFLNRLGMPIFKIPSGEITNFPYLRAIGALTRPVILSTGMANLGEVEKAMDVLVESGTLREKITLLHCTSDYPAPFEDVNLKAMVTLGHAFQVPVGYSDHTQGIEVSIAAVAMGAVVIEKHFTLDQSLPGPDHKASLNPDELSALVRGIRNVEKALGSGIKKATPNEENVSRLARKSLVAAIPIPKGTLFSPENVTVKRPGTGLPPAFYEHILGSPASKNFAPDDLIHL